MHGSNGEHIGRRRHAGGTYPSRMADSARSQSPPLRTKSSRGAAAVLNAIYEEDFLGFSYGFRPERSQHDALDALVGITGKKVNYILDADIRASSIRSTKHGSSALWSIGSATRILSA